MRTSNFIRTFVVISACLLWWHCCFCDSSSSLIKEDVGTQKNRGTSAEQHSGPNQEPQSKNAKENLKVNDGKQIKETVRKDTHSKENLVNSVKISKIESEEIGSSELLHNAETKSKSHSHAKSDVLQSHHENAEDSNQKAQPVSAETKHSTTTSPEDAKLPPLKQNLSTSKISTANKHVADRAQENSVPQSESLVLEESITPPLSSSVPEQHAERHEPVLPSHQHAPESQTKAKVGDASVVDETEADSVLHHQHPHSEAMPSFDEWKRMMLAEQEKEGLKIPSVSPGKKIASQKRKRNYASYECGAKIVGSNSEAEGTSRILNELVDEYMLNPCKAKIWFVIELCETVQALQIELANFELFSSCPKDFAVYSSDHYPSRDWLLLGTFTAAEQRVLQSFELKQEGFGKFIKVELLSYYGKEHYCPLSVVRIFGTSMVDEYEEMETAGNIQSVSEDDEDRLDVEFNVEDVSPGNLFGSAKDAVLSMVKKAAQVLVRDQPAEGDSMNLTEHQNMSEEEVCKLFPDSSGSCSSLNVTKADSSVTDLVPDVLIPYSSFHHVLFRYLRNCESCIVPSEDGNMTSAQPTCRFFQAALGPVVFKGICELFREKPLISVLPGKPASGVHVLKDSTKTSPKHSTSISPPPQIISVIIDGAVESKSLPAYSDSIPPSPVPHPDTSTSALLEELSSFPAPKIEEAPVNQVKVESIQPTKAFQDDSKEEELGLSSSLAEVPPPKASDEALESSVIDAVVQPSITDLKITSTPTDHSTLPSVGQSSVSSDSSSVVSGDVTPPSDASGFTISEKPLETPLSLQESNDTVLKMSTVKYEEPASLTEPAAFTPEDFSEAFQSQPSGLSDKEDKDSVLMGSVLSTAGGQKESVFMRMSNRIKALELNMSLSSQYLQELSQRYRRQMEEMQRAFNRTIGTLNDTARKAAERDIKQQEVISSLQAQVANLTHSVDLLITERNILFTKMVETHIFLMIVEAIVMITILSLCARRISSSSANFPCDSSAAERAIVSYQSIVKRRNSADSPPLPDVMKKIRKRSCSEEALRGDVVIIEPALIKVEPLPKVKKKTKKKNKGLRRSASNPSLVAKNSKYNPTLKNDECKEELCTAGVLFSASKSGRSLSTKPTGKDSGQSYCDENCNLRNCPKQTPGANCNKGQEKTKRVQSAPLQNLTNGVVSHSFCLSGHGDKTSDSSEARNFSLKKFLKPQKRDSV